MEAGIVPDVAGNVCAELVRAERITYAEAVRSGMYRALGGGDIDDGCDELDELGQKDLAIAEIAFQVAVGKW